MAGLAGTSSRRTSGPEAGDHWPAAGISLGHWAGIPVRAHWSVLVTLWLFADLLAVVVLPDARPHRSTGEYWLAGSLTSLAFLGLVVAHEVAHAVSARHYGMTVRRITLWMLGGVTELDGDPPSARADGVIAVSGPATSMASGGVAYAIAAAFGPGLSRAALEWLGGVNVLLGAFNLLPGAPLDGGRLLRAVLWGRSHDRVTASTTAARAGRALGVAFVALGLLQVLAGYLLGLWLVMLGWFIMSAASAEQARTGLSALRGTPVRVVMTPVSTVIPDWWTVERLAVELGAIERPPPALPLVDFGGAVSGVLHVRDLHRVPPARRGEQRLRDVLPRGARPPLVVAPDADVADLVPGLAAHGGCAVVVDGGTPVGIVTGRELVEALQLAELRSASRKGDAG